MIRRLRRVVVLAPSLAILMVLAAAGAASAADGLDLVEAAPVAPVVPPVDPKTTVAPIVPSIDPKTTVAPTVAEIEPVKDRAVKAAVQAVPDGVKQVVKAIVRGAEDEVGSIAPVPIPAVIPLDLDQGPAHVIQARRQRPRAADDAEPVAVLSSANAALLIPGHASPLATVEAQGLTNMSTPALQPGPLLGQFGPAGAEAIGGAGTDPAPCLRQGAWLRVPPAWQSGFAPAIPFAMPRGLTPQPLVPPG